MGARLTAVLANPPLTDGVRTIARVRQVAEILRFQDVDLVNLFALPTRATGEITKLGANPAAWLAARPAIERSLTAADGVLLAYGLRAPRGAAGLHFDDQLAWLRTELVTRSLQSWWVGEGPRHPSRWQRWTSRAHPGLVFTEALRVSVERADVGEHGGVVTVGAPTSGDRATGSDGQGDNGS